MLSIVKTTTTTNIEKARTNNPIGQSFFKIKQSFIEMIGTFKDIRKEEDKRSNLLERIRLDDEEERQERTSPRIIREDIETQKLDESRFLGGLIGGMSHIIRFFLSGFLHTLKRLLIIMVSTIRLIARALIPLFKILKYAIKILSHRLIRPIAKFVMRRTPLGAGLHLILDRLIDEAATEIDGQSLFGGISESLERIASGGEPERTSGSNNTAGGPSSSIPGNSTEAINFFISQGYTREQSAGIVANLIAESGLRPGIPGDRGQSHGIAQWNNFGARPGQPGRRDRIEQFLGRPVLQSSFQDQLRAVAWELSPTGPEARAGERLRQTRTAADAAIVIMNDYERPLERISNGRTRRSIAENLLRTSSPQSTIANSNIPTNSLREQNSQARSSQELSGRLPEQIQQPTSTQPARRILAASNIPSGQSHVHVQFVPVFP
jgi:hypothetical protein